MVFVEALCAMNLIANGMVNGLCCCYQSIQDEKRHKQHEQNIRDSIRTELGKSFDNNDNDNDDDDDDDENNTHAMRRDRSDGTKKSAQSQSTILRNSIEQKNNQRKQQIPRSSRDDFVQAYKNALQSRSQQHQLQPPQAPTPQDDHFQHEPLTPPHSLKLLQNSNDVHRDQPNSPTRPTTATSHKFPFFSSAQDGDDDERAPELFLYSSSSGSTCSNEPQPQHYAKEQPSFVNDHRMRSNSFLPPIRTSSSLLEDYSAATEYDHDWLNWDTHQNSANDGAHWQEWVHHDPSFASNHSSLVE